VQGQLDIIEDIETGTVLVMQFERFAQTAKFEHG
jgi:hypothetical protein